MEIKNCMMKIANIFPILLVCLIMAGFTPLGRLSASDKKWLKNRVHDRRPEVAEMAREVYNLHFPYAERNIQKKQLLINMLVFELHDTTVYNELGDEYPVNIRFTVNRLTNILTMTDFDADGIEQSITLEKKQMGKLLRWVIHTLEIFMWAEDYNLTPDNVSADDPSLDILPEFRPDGWDEEDDWFADVPLEPEEGSDAKVCWRVEIGYADEARQEIVSYRDYLFDKPDELFFALREYFEPETEEPLLIRCLLYPKKSASEMALDLDMKSNSIRMALTHARRAAYLLLERELNKEI